MDKTSDCKTCGKRIPLGGNYCIDCLHFLAKQRQDEYRRELHRKRRAKLKLWRTER